MTNKDQNPQDLDDGLTDEERAALLDEDGTDEDNESGDDQDNEDEGGDADGADDADDADDAANAGRDDGEPADDQAGEQGGAPQQAAPVFVAQAPADADVKLAEISTKKEELITQFDDGDITAKEYQQQLDALGKQERQIERDVDRASLAGDMEQQRQQNDWVTTVNSFLEVNKDYASNPRLHRALDLEVRDVAMTEEGKAMNGAQILAKSHANLIEAGMIKAQGKPAAGKAPKPNLPPNLARVPASESNDTSGGRFASLDRLATTDPMAYEDKLMSLSDADRRAYLAE